MKSKRLPLLSAKRELVDGMDIHSTNGFKTAQAICYMEGNNKELKLGQTTSQSLLFMFNHKIKKDC